MGLKKKNQKQMTKTFKFKQVLVLLLLQQLGLVYDSMEILGSVSSFCLLSFIPVAIYENADTEKIKIISDNNKKSGVYKWVNKENGNFSSLVDDSNKSLDLRFIVGFIDGEGSFSLQLTKDNNYSAGWRLKPSFGIGLDKKDLELLKFIQFSLKNLGNITKQGNEKFQWRISSKKDLISLIEILDKYSLITQKWSDYQLFKQAFEMYLNKEHLTIEGIKKLVAIKTYMNRCLPDELKKAFPDVKPVARPLIVNQIIYAPQWLAGFTSAEGCFMIQINKSSTHNIGFQTSLKFQITQHARDIDLMNKLIEYLGCGYYKLRPDKSAGDFIVSKFSDINEKIIPFFKLYPIVGVKALDFSDFCKVAEIIKTNDHLTEKGFEQIKLIKSNMNTVRK
uniref:Homing endonuclease LAGLIDADG domain-containing protein n=1 Tax=Orbilia brochopaga TaxID=3140254 RepID=A0A4Y5MZW8_9PEZI|nr:hypothetical protein [Drechslerella brochopaga]